MYKDKLEQLKEQAEFIYKYFHIAYADNHSTVITIKVSIDDSKEDTDYRIDIMVELCRKEL